MRYAAYDTATGKILQWGVGEPPPGMSYIEHDFEGELADYRVLDGALAPKAAMNLQLPGPTPADGVAEAVIAGLPAGTHADFAIGMGRYSLVVDDGTLELSVFDPQTVRIRLWHPIYQHPPVEVQFV